MLPRRVWCKGEGLLRQRHRLPQRLTFFQHAVGLLDGLIEAVVGNAAEDLLVLCARRAVDGAASCVRRQAK